MISKENFDVFCWIWIILALVLFPILTHVTQPYGRHRKSSWGPMINNGFAWFLMEVPALFVFFYFLSYTDNILNKIILTASFLWGLHYIHRAIIYPLRIRTTGKKMPIIIMVFGVFFNSINGFLNGYWLSQFAPQIEDSSIVDLRLIIGGIVFISGYIINKYHDRLLINLRKNKDNGYRIPFGGMFKYVSCPNFLGEIISWLGFFIVCNNLPALSFFIWAMVNLIPRALDHHKWYKSEFIEYPSERKAIIPYIL